MPKSAKTPDAIALLKADHDKVKKLFKEFERLHEDEEEERAEAVATQICNELKIHTTIEEEIFYPAMREALDEEDLLDEAEVEHASAKDLIEQIEGMSPSDDKYAAKVIVLGEYVNHHVEEEQGEMFPKAKKKGKLDLKALGEQMAARKLELQAEMGIDPEGEDPGGRKMPRKRSNGQRQSARA